MSVSTFKASLENLGFMVETEGKKSTKIVGRLGNVLKFVDDSKRVADFARPANRRMTKDITSNERNDFVGGSSEELLGSLLGRIDMKPFEAARVRLQQTGLIQKLQTKSQRIRPRRARVFSDIDGDWDYSRRYETQPFVGVTKVLTPVKTITIEVHFSISCNATQTDIDRYGAMAWAISQVIEKSGIQTRIVWILEGTHLTESGKKDFGRVEIELKKAGQYLAPSLLAAAMKANFFRRVGFAFLTASAELLDGTVSYSLGRCQEYPKPIEFKDGVLHISPDSAKGYHDEIEREVLKAIS